MKRTTQPVKVKAKRGRNASPRKRASRSKPVTVGGPSTAVGLAAALEDARRAGLLEGDKTEHVSFRAPPALIEAAKRETGVVSPSELGILALATLAQPDPVAMFLRRTHGRLGETHTLEY